MLLSVLRGSHKEALEFAEDIRKITVHLSYYCLQSRTYIRRLIGFLERADFSSLTPADFIVGQKSSQ